MLEFILIILVVNVIELAFIPGEKIAAAQSFVRKWVEKLKNKM